MVSYCIAASTSSSWAAVSLERWARIGLGIIIFNPRINESTKSVKLPGRNRSVLFAIARDVGLETSHSNKRKR